MRNLVLLCLCFLYTNAFQFYQERIPNGDLVPHPCKPNYLWKGVGHFNVQGGGDRNPFGMDFARLGKTWSEELCQMDSDGDGRSNGEELGDPECVWSSGEGAPSAVASGHPGVCEPTDSTMCKAKNSAAKEDWEFCKQGEFKCDAIKSPDVKNFTISISARTAVPAQETTYICQLVKLPDDQQYHIIATKPEIDNQILVHHITVFGCDETALEKIGYYSSPPQICNSMKIYEACTHSVGRWTVGSDGYCEVPNVGTRFGKRVFNYAVIEIHWNNPEKVPNYYDGSGLTIFYTPNLRKYDAATLTFGQQSLGIPADAAAHYTTAVCTPDCTNQMEQPLNLYSVSLHMHYLGRAGRVEHWRNGSLKGVLVDQSDYSYDNPIEFMIDPPAIFKAGDELKMFCKFTSTSRDNGTYYGDGTSDEMCFAFLNYYPKTEFSYCTTYGPLDVCDTAGQDIDLHIYDTLKSVGCDYVDFQKTMKKFEDEAYEACGGVVKQECNEECKTYFEHAYSNHTCLRNDLRFMAEQFMMWSDQFMGKEKEYKDYIEFLRICDKQLLEVRPKPLYWDKDLYIVAGGTMLMATVFVYMVSLTVLCINFLV